MKRHERPLRRVNPSGKTVWVARYTDRHGKRQTAKPAWNRGKGTFELKKDAQRAIDEAYEKDWAPQTETTVRAYAASWTARHPRAMRTNTSYNHRVGRTLAIEVDGKVFGEWPIGEVRRRHANLLLDHLLRKQGRSAVGAQGILRVLSAMWQNALDDEVAEVNPFFGVRVKATDPRVTKEPVRARLFKWDDTARFALAAAEARTGKHEPARIDEWRPLYAEAMVRLLRDCGLRLGELLPLERRDVKMAGPCDERGCPVTDPHLHVRRTAHEGWVQSGTKTDHGTAQAGRTVALSPRLQVLLPGLPARIDTRLLFTTPRGKMWRESGFYRDVWYPAQRLSGLDCRPHEFRHSWVSQWRAAGVDVGDLASMAGHTVLTATTRYTHSTGRSYGRLSSEAV